MVAFDEIHVLHVDDEPDFADMTASFLEREDKDLELKTATSPEEGLAILEEHDLDGIISDYDMPGRNGVEFLETVREQYPDLPFILYTGKGSEEVASEAISAGVTDYLQKGSGTDQYALLANRVKNAVERTKADQRAEKAQARYQTLIDDVLETSDIGTFILDADFNIVWINSAVEKYFDLTRNDIIEADKRQLIDSEIADKFKDPERFKDRVTATYDDNTYVEEFSCHVLPGEDRRERWLKHWSQPIESGLFEGGRIEHYTDITERKEREQELRRTERRFEAMFQDPNILVGLIDTDGTVLDINETALQYIDDELGEIIDGPFWETSWFSGDAEIQAEVKDWIDRAADGEYVEFEADLSESVGESLIVNGVFRPVKNDEGEVVSLLISDRDITERKERERELRRTERRFEAVLEDPNILAGVLDTDGRLLEANQTAMEYVEADVEDVTGELFWETPWWPEEMQPAVRDNVEQAAQGQYVSYEADLETPDGEPYSVEGVIRPVTDDSGTVVSLIVSARDITDLAVREQRLETILENTENPLFMKDREGRYLLVNEGYKRVFGLEETEVIGRTDAEIFPPEMAEEVRENDRQVLETGDTVEKEERIVVNGEARTFFSTKTPVFDIGTESDPEGPVAVFGVAQDITEQKSREERLKRQNERFDELSNVISHDLQTPLETAKGLAELAVETGDTDEMERALAALERADELRQDLVNVLRTRSIVDETEPVDLEGIGRDAWETVTKPEEALLNIRDAPRIEADPDAVRRLLENFLSNTVEHGNGDITVEIGATQGGFFVEDDGPGIPKDEREEVFTPGYSTKRGGAGVGLASVRQIIMAHDWDIHIDEGAEGGARFEITGVEELSAD